MYSYLPPDASNYGDSFEQNLIDGRGINNIDDNLPPLLRDSNVPNIEWFDVHYLLGI